MIHDAGKSAAVSMAYAEVTFASTMCASCGFTKSSVAIHRPFKYISSGVISCIRSSCEAYSPNAGSKMMPLIIAAVGAFTTGGDSFSTARSARLVYSLTPINAPASDAPKITFPLWSRCLRLSHSCEPCLGLGIAVIVFPFISCCWY